jgi:hypothetical protein
MRENITKVSQRGERLDSLQDKTDNLAVSAQGFRRGANRVRKQMWWKDMKMRVCLVVCVIVLLVVIIVPGKLAKTIPAPGFGSRRVGLGTLIHIVLSSVHQISLSHALPNALRDFVLGWETWGNDLFDLVFLTLRPWSCVVFQPANTSCCFVLWACFE